MLPAGKFRHGDHRFEWSREQFRSWANGIAERFGYNVEIKPVADEDPQVGSPTQMGVSTRGNLLAYLTTEVARTIGRFVHRVTVIWASRFIGAPAQHPSFPVPAQPPREAMLDDQCGAEPRCVGLNVVDYPFFCPRCERVKQEDGSLIGDENVRRDWLFL